MYKVQIGFFLTLMVITLGLSLWLFTPFFTPLVLAIISAVIFYPLYQWFTRHLGGRRSIASLVTVLFIVLVIGTPLSFFGYLVFQEAVSLYQGIVRNGSTTSVFFTSIQSVENVFNSYVPFSIDLTSYFSISDQVQSLISWITSRVGSIFSQVLQVGLGVVVFILALFYLLRDGHGFIDKVITLSPLNDDHDRRIFAKIKQAVDSVIKGDVVIALIQGILAGVGLWVFGVPSPALWAFVAAVAAFVPSVGTGLVLVPAIVFVFVTGGWLWALGLFVWSAVIVGLVDNILRPIVIDRGMHVHPLLILLAVLGGLEVFGPVGFVVGPVILSLLVALLDIYPLLMKRAQEHIAIHES